MHCRNIQHTVQSRLLRLRALIQLDLFNQAHRVIHILLDGQKLPTTQLFGQYRSNVIDTSSSKFKVKQKQYSSQLVIINHYLFLVTIF